MLIWINGPFGVGKTQTAFELHRRLPGSVVCDPENVGYGLHRTMPAALRSDFQDLSSWRHGVHEVLSLVLRGHQGPVIAPMTLVVPRYFAEIVGRLREDGHDVRHFALLAERATVLDRLRRRSRLGLTVDTFAEGKLDGCLDQLHRPEFAEHIRTDDLTVAQVAGRVADSAGLSLTSPDGPVLGRLRRSVVGLRHIRIG
ncbi:AAA family ATPase [Pseudonocardia spinosispora]|uniref:AAA family ATPase n=1 Tax=Pseudonocardia spinosispora TaxID=103441 RepID=UPI00041F100A|nr:AAA family ATPase [Pseudonocardia spinosispora]